MKILLDNGHGVNTTGKRSPDGVFREYKYTREIALEVEIELRRLGYNADRIVREESDVSLSTRVRRVNDICADVGAKNCLLVSIHCNAAGDGTKWMNATGWSAYTTKGVTKSDKLADCLYRAAEKHLNGMRIRKDMQDGDPDWEADFYIIKHSACPAVLIENPFMDNKEDVKWMLSTAGRRAIVMTIVDGIVEYIEQMKQ
ncbi:MULTISPECIES: N-acetylmuramoyl-L-alanine amidase [Bacteroidales]|uniref:N-acetylmuramoyl-L-alanine amidase n=1 Tax=Bacteroidales TaxID=171549 RepID=UPI0035A0492C